MRLRLAVLAVFLTLMAAAVRAAEGDQKPSFKVSGDYLEGCSCKLFCPCDFGRDATEAKGCQGTLAFHVDKGTYGKVSLDGLTVAGVILSPTPNVAAAAGKMEGGLYIDEKANKEQRAALEDIIKTQIGPLFGKLNGPKFVPFKFAKTGASADGYADEYSLEIPGIATLGSKTFKTKEGKRSRRVDAPEPVVPDQLYAEATTHTYNDKDWKTQWDFKGRNSFAGRFEWSR